MLSIGRVGPNGADYYLDQVARTRDDYYTGAGETAGYWAGSGAAHLGLSGEVGDQQFSRLIDGQHPDTGQALVASSEKRVAGFDLTFSCPKSVSVLWGLAEDPWTVRSVGDAHRAAVADAIAYLETDAVWARRGDGGTRRVPTAGLTAAAFAHRTSRAGDPQLHTHVVAANLVSDLDGRYSALDSRAVYRHARTAGYVYQAALRYELSLTLGAEWGPVRNGYAELARIPRALVDGFSKRRAQITQALEDRGLGSMHAARVATLDTRPTKPAIDPAGLGRRWQDEATSLGHRPDRIVYAVTGLDRSEPIVTAAGLGELVEHLVSPGGLTAHAATFDRRDIIRAAAGHHRAGARYMDLEVVAAKIAGHPGVVEMSPPDALRPARQWTTTDLLVAEAHIQELAAGRADARVAVASTNAIDAAIGARPGLSGEQETLVRGICSSGAGVEVIVGKPGTGKTYALDAARAAWEASGVRVIGTAVAARTAAGLEAGTGIPACTLARLLADLERPGTAGLAAGSAVVVDEAGMVGTRDLQRLLTIAARDGLKVVLVGDHAQLPEIAAGGSFGRLASQAGVHELTVNRRQTEVWEHDALDRLRARQPKAALDAYTAHGRVTVADTAAAARAAMVADWYQAHNTTGAAAVMYALRRADIAELNALARDALRADGQLAGPTITVDRPDRSGSLEFAMGDRIVCRRNDRRLGLTNRTAGTVTAIDPEHRSVVIDNTVVIPASYLDAGHLDHSYAMTVHKSQGATIDHAFLLGDDRLYAEGTPPHPTFRIRRVVTSAAVGARGVGWWSRTGRSTSTPHVLSATATSRRAGPRPRRHQCHPPCGQALGRTRRNPPRPTPLCRSSAWLGVRVGDPLGTAPRHPRTPPHPRRPRPGMRDGHRNVDRDRRDRRTRTLRHLLHRGARPHRLPNHHRPGAHQRTELRSREVRDLRRHRLPRRSRQPPATARPHRHRPARHHPPPHLPAAIHRAASAVGARRGRQHRPPPRPPLDRLRRRIPRPDHPRLSPGPHPGQSPVGTRSRRVPHPLRREDRPRRHRRAEHAAHLVLPRREPRHRLHQRGDQPDRGGPAPRPPTPTGSNDPGSHPKQSTNSHPASPSSPTPTAASRRSPCDPPRRPEHAPGPNDANSACSNNSSASAPRADPTGNTVTSKGRNT